MDITTSLASFTPAGWLCNMAWTPPSLEPRVSAIEAAMASASMDKWAHTGLTTNASGVYSVNLGAGLFNGPPVLDIAPKMGSGSYDWRYTVSGNPAAGYTVTVTFTQRKNTIDISLGALIGVGLIEAATGVVTFDMSASEQTA